MSMFSVENRKKAFETLYSLLPKEEYHPIDSILEELIRFIRGFPTRPASRETYEGLFGAKNPSSLITEDILLKAGISSNSAEKFAVALNGVCSKYGINTPLKMSHFLAQVAHESLGFTVLVENLNYSEEGLLRIFPKYFTRETAKTYARKPEMIANIVYANRLGNGNRESGDGWKFRGRGLIQLTGKYNYEKFTKDSNVDIITDVEQATRPDIAAEIAGWYWNSRNINTLADGDDIVAVTKAINGGTNGLEDRRQWLYKFKKAFGI